MTEQPPHPENERTPPEELSRAVAEFQDSFGRPPALPDDFDWFSRRLSAECWDTILKEHHQDEGEAALNRLVDEGRAEFRSLDTQGEVIYRARPTTASADQEVETQTREEVEERRRRHPELVRAFDSFRQRFGRDARPRDNEDMRWIFDHVSRPAWNAMIEDMLREGVRGQLDLQVREGRIEVEGVADGSAISWGSRPAPSEIEDATDEDEQDEPDPLPPAA